MGIKPTYCTHEKYKTKSTKISFNQWIKNKLKIMIDINKEAEEYAQNEIKDRGDDNDKLICKIDFIAGYNSKATQAKILQAQIDILKENRNPETMYWLDNSIEKLQKQLKELKNE